MAFPIHRMRRLRATEALRNLVRETLLDPADFILPLFICPGEGVRREISSMPGHAQLSVDRLVKECAEAHSLGIGGVILFGIPETKDEIASGAYADDGIVQQAVRALKREVPKLLVMTDVCNCEYTSHGHCGLVVDGEVQNDPTLEWLAKAAVSHARAGADIVAPSDMMDGRVAAIRKALDAAGFINTPIVSYAAKYASVFYGPFREAAESTPQFGDRRSYQMDPANAREAMREIELDIEEGADMIMVKPAMPYLDIIREARERFPLPLGAYQVSGEFSMLTAAIKTAGWIATAPFSNRSPPSAAPARISCSPISPRTPPACWPDALLPHRKSRMVFERRFALIHSPNFGPARSLPQQARPVRKAAPAFRRRRLPRCRHRRCEPSRGCPAPWPPAPQNSEIPRPARVRARDTIWLVSVRSRFLDERINNNPAELHRPAIALQQNRSRARPHWYPARSRSARRCSAG